RRRHTRFSRDWSSDVCSSDLGDLLPVSALPVDGTYPSGTTRFEKRNIAVEIPEWDPAVCIQCNKCVLVCPHAVIRAKVYDPALRSEERRVGKEWGALF